MSEPGGSGSSASRDLWDTRYREAAVAESTVWSATPNALIAETVADFLPGIAVDLGCGEGRNAIWLASRGWQVFGVDFSAAGIEVALTRAAAAGVAVDWEVADATAWVAPEPVDLVVCAYLQLPADGVRAALANATASLAPGGRLVVIGHDLDNLTRGTGGPQRADILYSVELLRSAVPDLVIERCEQVVRVVSGPDGASDAIDTVLVARKPVP